MPKLSSRLPLLATAAVAALAFGGTVGCEKHPAGETAQGYGHGSARPGSKGGDKHQPDGASLRYTDSQGTDVRPMEKEHGESETHASGPEHGRPGPGGQRESEHPVK